MRKASLIFLLVTAVCCSACLADGKDIVGQANEPIHPLLIGMFSDWVDGKAPYLHSIDLDAAPPHEFASTVPKKLENGWIIAEIPDSQPVARFGYKILGELDNGIMVVMTQYDGGGSGRFQKLMLFRIYWKEPVLVGSKECRILELVGSAVLGDRDSGRISIGPDSVTIGRSQHRDEEIVLRLNQKP